MGDAARAFILRLVLVLVLVFLVFPVAIVLPLSSSSAAYLSFPPPGYSLRWYVAFFADPAWLQSALVSIVTALGATLLSVVLGVPAAIGLVRGRFPGKAVVQALLLSPIVAPGIVVAIGLYYVYARFGLVGRPIALVIAQAALAVPFVVINVSAALSGLDPRLERAALSLGATPWGTFRQITLPLIRPGIFAGAVFAFVTAFDELLIALFLSGSTAVTLPRRMWEQLQFNLNPTIAAASSLLIVVTTVLMLGGEMMRRRAERLRTGGLAKS